MTPLYKKDQAKASWAQAKQFFLILFPAILLLYQSVRLTEDFSLQNTFLSSNQGQGVSWDESDPILEDINQQPATSNQQLIT